MNNNNNYSNINDEYRDIALTRLLESISNRRLIQHLRLELFKNCDFEPKNLGSLNLHNSSIEKDIYWWIIRVAQDILEQLEENKGIYLGYFHPSKIGLRRNVRDLLLENEEELFGWEIFYTEYLKKFIEDKDRLEIDPVGYYQKLYDFITLELTYDGVYEILLS